LDAVPRVPSPAALYAVSRFPKIPECRARSCTVRVYAISRVADCVCRGANPNCFRCSGTGVIGRFSTNAPSTEHETFVDELRAITARPGARQKKKASLSCAPSQALAQTAQTGRHLSRCPQCGANVRLTRLAKHLSERCPKRQVLMRTPVPVERKKQKRNATASRDALPWVCPTCFAIIGGPDVSQPVALDLWRQHASTTHAASWTKTHTSPIRASSARRRSHTPPPPAPAPAPVSYIVCERCGDTIRADSTGLHSLTCQPSNSRPRSLNALVAQLPFTLLPQGTWSMHDLITHYRDQATSFPADLQGRRIDKSRLEKIASLRPQKCYVGKESWSGYVVFEFGPATPVVLECPVEGNATYILAGDWRTMVRHSKGEMRRRFPRHHIRIVHNGDWLARLRASLRAARRIR
jgi:hypothetical protein